VGIIPLTLTEVLSRVIFCTFSPSAELWAILKSLISSQGYSFYKNFCLASHGRKGLVWLITRLVRASEEVFLVVVQVKLASKLMLRWGLGLILSVHCLVASAQASEAGLRVAFVYNFLKFIEWPALQGSQFSLCALGAQDVTRQSLAQLDNKPYQQRRIKVIYIDSLDLVAQQLTNCQLLYVPNTGADLQLPQSFPSGVLLVVDEADPNDARVGISLQRTADNRIEFVMNEQAIQHAGVKVSSQLLKLAKKRKEGGS
jgi:YfiR/HmsC-like